MLHKPRLGESKPLGVPAPAVTARPASCKQNTDSPFEPRARGDPAALRPDPRREGRLGYVPGVHKRDSVPLGLTPAESPGVVSFRANFRKETWALPRVRLAVPKRRTCEDGVGAALSGASPETESGHLNAGKK